jgi:hypothetical protein
VREPLLRDGRLHLSAIAMLAPLLTPANRDSLLARATHLSKREIEELIAELSPRPDVASSIRRLPVSHRARNAEGARTPDEKPHGTATATHTPRLDELVPGRVEVVPDTAATERQGASSVASVRVLSPGRCKVQFTASAALRDKLERLAALMRSEVPDGDLGSIIERAVAEKLERLEAPRFAKTTTRRSEPTRQRRADSRARPRPRAAARKSGRDAPDAGAPANLSGSG